MWAGYGGMYVYCLDAVVFELVKARVRRSWSSGLVMYSVVAVGLGFFGSWSFFSEYILSLLISVLYVYEVEFRDLSLMILNCSVMCSLILLKRCLLVVSTAFNIGILDYHARTSRFVSWFSLFGWWPM